MEFLFDQEVRKLLVANLGKTNSLPTTRRISRQVLTQDVTLRFAAGTGMAFSPWVGFNEIRLTLPEVRPPAMQSMVKDR